MILGTTLHMGMDRHGIFCPSCMALLSISAGLVLYFKETHYFFRFKVLMESMFSGDEFLPSEKILLKQNLLSQILYIF